MLKQRKTILNACKWNSVKWIIKQDHTHNQWPCFSYLLLCKELLQNSGFKQEPLYYPHDSVSWLDSSGQLCSAWCQLGLHSSWGMIKLDHPSWRPHKNGCLGGDSWKTGDSWITGTVGISLSSHVISRPVPFHMHSPQVLSSRVDTPLIRQLWIPKSKEAEAAKSY